MDKLNLNKNASSIRPHLDHWIVYDDNGDPVGAYLDREEASIMKREVDRTNWLKRSRDWVWNVRERNKTKKSYLNHKALEEVPKLEEVIATDPALFGLSKPAVYPPDYMPIGDLTPQQTKEPGATVVEKYDLPGSDYSETDGYGKPFKHQQVPWKMYDPDMPSGLPDANYGELHMSGKLNISADIKLPSVIPATPADASAIDEIAYDTARILEQQYKKSPAEIDTFLNPEHIRGLLQDIHPDLSTPSEDEVIPLVTQLLQMNLERMVPAKEDMDTPQVVAEAPPDIISEEEKEKKALEEEVQHMITPALNEARANFNVLVYSRGYPLRWSEFVDTFEQLKAKHNLDQKTSDALVQRLIGDKILWGEDVPGKAMPAQNTPEYFNLIAEIYKQNLKKALAELSTYADIMERTRKTFNEAASAYANDSDLLHFERFLESKLPALQYVYDTVKTRGIGAAAGVAKHYEETLFKDVAKASRLLKGLESLIPIERTLPSHSTEYTKAAAIARKIEDFLRQYSIDKVSIEKYTGPLLRAEPAPVVQSSLRKKADGLIPASVEPSEEELKETSYEETEELEEEEEAAAASKDIFSYDPQGRSDTLLQEMENIKKEQMPYFVDLVKDQTPDAPPEQIQSEAEIGFNETYPEATVQNLAQKRLPEEATAATDEETVAVEPEEASKLFNAENPEFLEIKSRMQAKRPGIDDAMLTAMARVAYIKLLDSRRKKIEPTAGKLLQDLNTLLSTPEFQGLYYNFDNPGYIRHYAISPEIQDIYEKIDDATRLLDNPELSEQKRAEYSLKRDRMQEKFDSILNAQHAAFEEKIKPMQQDWDDKVALVMDPYARMSHKEKLRYIPTPEQFKLDPKVVRPKGTEQHQKEQRPPSMKERVYTQEELARIEDIKKEREMKHLKTTSAFDIPEFQIYIEEAQKAGITQIAEGEAEKYLQKYPGFGTDIPTTKSLLQTMFNMLGNANIAIIGDDKLTKQLKALEKF